MELELRYQEIEKRFEECSDFSGKDLVRSRNLFNLENSQVVPKRFEVWTTLVGLPLPEGLTQNFQNITQQLIERLPANTRFYSVLPQNYHWEVFIIKRPDEEVDSKDLQKTPNMLEKILSNHPPFSLCYRGVLINTDGTIIAKGYGDFDQLRAKLRQAIPFASLQQSQLGHVSLGRILDPVGSQAFTQLKQFVQNSQHEFYGELDVSQINYVHESQWYMEQRDIVATVPFGSAVDKASC
ncbi:MAG: hypothetical protein AB1589_34765 [Cyanobacteriota bacterium]